MIDLGPECLLFIEPTEPCSAEPVEDELTQKMRVALNEVQSVIVHAGFGHQCACGAQSTDDDYELPGGLVTHSLAVHYLQYHRDEVPSSEIEKLRAIQCSSHEATYDFDNPHMGEPNPDASHDPEKIQPEVPGQLVNSILGEAVMQMASRVRLELNTTIGTVFLISDSGSQQFMQLQPSAMIAVMDQLKILASGGEAPPNPEFSTGKFELLMEERNRGFSIRLEFRAQLHSTARREILVFDIRRFFVKSRHSPPLDIGTP